MSKGLYDDMDAQIDSEFNTVIQNIRLLSVDARLDKTERTMLLRKIVRLAKIMQIETEKLI